MPTSQWREVRWTDENNREVKKLICHVDELPEVIASPFPKGAVVREPVYEFTGVSTTQPKFFRRCLVKVGDQFDEFINQGKRDCQVMAIDPETGRYLYEYDMPNGTTALRWSQWTNGVEKHGQVSYRALSKRWRKLIAEDGVGLTENPQ